MSEPPQLVSSKAEEQWLNFELLLKLLTQSLGELQKIRSSSSIPALEPAVFEAKLVLKDLIICVRRVKLGLGHNLQGCGSGPSVEFDLLKETHMI